jgi:transposase
LSAPLLVRALTVEERGIIESLARSRTEPARVVERARIILHSSDGQLVPVVARLLNISTKPVRLWIKRFNAAGLVGLRDEPRSGRPATYTSEEIGEVIATSLTNPKSLGLPFGSWTLDRLEAYLNEHKGIPIKRSRIDEILIAEGLRWRTQETWFGDRVDPEFAKKRGSSPGYIPSHRQEV